MAFPQPSPNKSSTVIERQVEVSLTFILVMVPFGSLTFVPLVLLELITYSQESEHSKTLLSVTAVGAVGDTEGTDVGI